MKNTNYSIYQIKDVDEEHPKFNRIRNRIFRDLDDKVIEVNLDEDNYFEVYSGFVECNIQNRDGIYRVLENIFVKFNIDRPKDFNARSLSVSDIIKINGRYFYCETILFKEIKVV